MSDSPWARPSPQGEISLERDPGWPCPPPKALCLLSAPASSRTGIRSRPPGCRCQPPRQPPAELQASETLPLRVLVPGSPQSSLGRSQAGPAEAGGRPAGLGHTGPPEPRAPTAALGSPQLTSAPARGTPAVPFLLLLGTGSGPLGSSDGHSTLVGRSGGQRTEAQPHLGRPRPAPPGGRASWFSHSGGPAPHPRFGPWTSGSSVCHRKDPLSPWDAV